MLAGSFTSLLLQRTPRENIFSAKSITGSDITDTPTKAWGPTAPHLRNDESSGLLYLFAPVEHQSLCGTKLSLGHRGSLPIESRKTVRPSSGCVLGTSEHRRRAS